MIVLFIVLFMDENVHAQVAVLLREEAYTICTTRDEGRLGASDPNQLQYAAAHEWTLVTNNRKDFTLLHESWITWQRAAMRRYHRSRTMALRPHSGILTMDQGPSAAAITAAIDRLLRTTPSLSNALYEWRRETGWTRFQ